MNRLAEHFKSREDPHKVFFDSLDFTAYLSSFSALDRYFDLPWGYYLNVATTASLVEVARFFDEPEFPGLPDLDAAIRVYGMEVPSGMSFLSDHIFHDENLLLVSCQLEEGNMCAPRNGYGFPRSFLYSPSGRRFYDTEGFYPILRGKAFLTASMLGLEDSSSWEPWLDTAILLSRYPLKLSFISNTGNQDSLHEVTEDREPDKLPEFRFPSPRESDAFSEVDPFRQREVLIRILEGRNPSRGMDFLRRCGFIRSHWPELFSMIRVRQGKEDHPEGDVWDHSLAVFSYRKNTDLLVSLALLLHDSGKPEAREEEGNRFNRHAQLGGRVAGRFLRRLDFPDSIIDPVVFLVSNHMIPGITRTLPPFRVKEIISSPLYPLLLEVYRCDLSSTYRGPGGYYEACKVYRRYLKHAGNPFRDSSGRKLLKFYVEN